MNHSAIQAVLTQAANDIRADVDDKSVTPEEHIAARGAWIALTQAIEAVSVHENGGVVDASA